MMNLMLGLCENVQRLRELCGQSVVEQKFHAANSRSNSTALSTASRLISYQRATSSAEPLALTLLARTAVGTPSAKTMGCPKLRFGSSATLFSLPRGHQRTRT